jgi:hypothetical protein
MEEHRLGQVLIVAPDVSFIDIHRGLTEIGGERTDTAPAHPPLIAGEPEIAAWKWGKGKPFITYSFNPVVRLRVLDVANLPPILRGAIAARLPLVSPAEVERLLSADLPRRRLLGLWAARETERIDLMPQIQQLAADSEPVVVKASAEVVHRLGRIREARLQVLAHLRLLAEAAQDLIRRLDDPAFVRKLCPDRSDCAKLFDEELADAVSAEVTRIWARPPAANPGERYHVLEVTAAAAGLLRWPNELSDAFPRGYRDIAGWMVPNRVWLSWAWKADDGGAVRYDGLAWLDDHWVWIPKAFRILGPLVIEPLERAPRVLH